MKVNNGDMPDVSAEIGKAHPLDLQIANAIQWLDADDHPHVADDMRDARAKVAALVEALKNSLIHFESQHAFMLEIRSPPFVILRDEMVAAQRGEGE